MGANAQLILGASLVWAGVFVFGSVIVSFAYAGFRKLTVFAPPSPRGLVIALYAFLPLLVASLVVSLLNFSALYSWLLPEHCHEGSCAPHAPEFAATAAQAAVSASAMFIAAIIATWFAARHLRIRFRQSRFARKLGQPQQDYCIMDSDQRAAWCDGLWRPTVYVSRGLLDSLDTPDLQIVVAHEQAHARRRDNLTRLLLHWATLLWPTAIQRLLRRDFAVAAEQACDAEAAALSGDNARVSNLITRLESLLPPQQQAETTGTCARQAELMRPHPYRPASMLAPWFALVMLWLGSAFILTLAAHPLLETLSV